MKKKPNKRILLFFGLFMMILLSGYFLWKQKGSESKEGIDHFLQNLKASKETAAKMDEVYATSHTDFVLEEETDLTAVEETSEQPAEQMTEQSWQEAADREPITNEIVKIRDLYVEKEAAITMKSFYPDATAYHWEQYDLKTKNWIVLDSTMGMDELSREVSMCTVFCEEAISPVMLRCTVSTPEQKYEDIASIYVLNKEIKTISVPGCEANAGEYLSAKDVPVNITYIDGSQEQIKGLYGLYWIEEEASTEYSFSVSGNVIETVTTVFTDMEYRYIELGKARASMRYRMQEQNKGQDILTEIEGKDLAGPDILKVELGDYQVINEDKAVPVWVTITAVDNYTNYKKLSYCFLPSGIEPEEEDWKENPSWEADIDKNGIWVAYVKDENGNISTAERELIVVDQKAPDIQISLENTDWCESTKIMVEGTDNSAILYCYACPSTGENSGWTEAAEYAVSNNGIWAVSAKDTLGNTVTKEITISNIDKQMPVIHGISIITNAEGENE